MAAVGTGSNSRPIHDQPGEEKHQMAAKAAVSSKFPDEAVIISAAPQFRFHLFFLSSFLLGVLLFLFVFCLAPSQKRTAVDGHRIADIGQRPFLPVASAKQKEQNCRSVCIFCCFFCVCFISHIVFLDDICSFCCLVVRGRVFFFS